jgi:hypothetical protein
MFKSFLMVISSNREAYWTSPFDRLGVRSFV